jgi:hypothetical protein
MIYQEKIFTKEECDTIIGYSDIYKNTKEYFTNEVDVIDNRLQSKNGKLAYDVYVILNDETTEWFFNKLQNWFSIVSGIKLNKNEKMLTCTLHCYKTGDKFPKHIDLSVGFNYRRYNLGIQLNDTYEGGEYICVDNNNNEILISKEVGTSLAYYATVPHEIKEITKGERWSIVLPLTKDVIIEKKELI